MQAVVIILMQSLKLLLRCTRHILVCSAPLAILMLVFWWYSDPYELDGPTSSRGHTVEADVRGCGLSWGADFNTDVTIHGRDGKTVLRWQDIEGQYPRGGPERLVKSMQWDASGSRLTFQTEDDHVITMNVTIGEVREERIKQPWE